MSVRRNDLALHEARLVDALLEQRRCGGPGPPSGEPTGWRSSYDLLVGHELLGPLDRAEADQEDGPRPKVMPSRKFDVCTTPKGPRSRKWLVGKAK